MHTPRPLLMMVWLLMLSLCASAAERVNWLTGPALRKKLEQPESVAWSGQALREAMFTFSRAHRVAIVLDRRIDPGQPLEASHSNIPLSEILDRLAEQDNSRGVSYLDALVYLGPRATTDRLRTVLELRKAELSQLPNARRLAWVQARPWSWEDFATPRDLLAELAKEGKFEITNLPLVPHDLWAAADLPPLGMTERLTVVLAHFDLTFRIDAAGSAITLGNMPDEPRVERSYPGGAKADELAKKLAASLTGAEVRVADGKVLVRATVEQHEQIASGVVRTPRPVAGSDDALERKTFSLTATNQPVNAILNSLKEQLGLELKIDAAGLRKAGKSMEMLVSVKVKEANLDETLKAALAPAGLTFRRTGKIVEIMPEEK